MWTYNYTGAPDELMHYGRLGMKWGKHIFGDEKMTSLVTKKSEASL